MKSRMEPHDSILTTGEIPARNNELPLAATISSTPTVTLHVATDSVQSENLLFLTTATETSPKRVVETINSPKIHKVLSRQEVKTPSPATPAPKLSIQTKAISTGLWNFKDDTEDQSTEIRSPYMEFYSRSLRTLSPYEFRLSVGEEHPIKRYHAWRGNNTFFCSGRLMTGPHPYQLLLSLFLILTSSICFTILIVPFCRIIPLYHVYFFLVFNDILFLLITSFTEPGIYPKRLLPENQTSDLFQSKYHFLLKDQYCMTCGIIHSTRAKHCKYCNNCIEVFDHHCPWTGNCIGIRNYAPFFIFITTMFLTLLLMLLVLLQIIIFLIWSFTIKFHIMAFIFLLVITSFTIWISLMFIFISALFFLHLYLCWRGQTTSEYFRQRRIKQKQAIGFHHSNSRLSSEQSPLTSPTPLEESNLCSCFETLINNCGSIVDSISRITPWIFQRVSLSLTSTITRNQNHSTTSLPRQFTSMVSKDPEDGSDLPDPTMGTTSGELPVMGSERQQAVFHSRVSSSDHTWWSSCNCCSSNHNWSQKDGIQQNYQKIGDNPQLSQQLHTRLLPFWQYENGEDDEQQEILLEILYHHIQHELFSNNE